MTARYINLHFTYFTLLPSTQITHRFTKKISLCRYGRKEKCRQQLDCLVAVFDFIVYFMVNPHLSPFGSNIFRFGSIFWLDFMVKCVPKSIHPVIPSL